MELLEEVKKELERIRPYIQADGGGLELVEVTPEGEVRIRLTGACSGCPSSSMTLKMGIERTLKQNISGVTSVTAI